MDLIAWLVWAASAAAPKTPAALRGEAAAGAAAAALAAASLTAALLSIALREVPASETPAGFEALRRARLRAAKPVYRWFEALIVDLAAWEKRRAPASYESLSRQLTASGDKTPWTAYEYLAIARVESLAAGLGGASFGYILTGSVLAALAAGGACVFGYQKLMTSQVASRSQRRVIGVKKRLPYAVELMALMMEVGAGFHEALSVVVRESQGTPLAEEFGEVLRETEMGRARAESLEGLAGRLNDDDLNELVLAVVKGEELGTPLAQILRGQAQQMLTKRSLWIEKASQEAQVMIVFPGMIIMIACLLIVTAPFVLSAIYSY